MRSLLFAVIAALVVALVSAFDLLSLIPYFGRMHYGDVAYIYGVMNTITLWGIIAALYWHFKAVMLPRLTGWNKHYERLGDVKRAEEARYTARFLHIVILILAGTALSLTLKAFDIQPTSAMGNVQITPSEPSWAQCDTVIDAKLMEIRAAFPITFAHGNTQAVEDMTLAFKNVGTLEKLYATVAANELTQTETGCANRINERFDMQNGRAQHSGI